MWATTSLPGSDGRVGPDCEWVSRTLAHQVSARVPYNFMFSPPAQRRAESHFGQPLVEALGLPVRMTSLRSVKPLYAAPAQFGPLTADEFGVVWANSPIDRGVPVGPCLPGPSLSGYRFPDPLSPHRFVDLEPWSAAQAGHFRIVWVGDLWERAAFMRGMEALLLDVALHPAFVEQLLERLAEHVLRTLAVVLQRCPCEAVALSDDYGTQRGMLLSPAVWRRLIKPRLAPIYALARSAGRAVLHHTCGDVEPIVGDLVDIGLDILHPIQPEAMDILRLKRQFGAHLTLCGGVPTQGLLVHGAPAQVRAEVHRLQRQMGGDGGYILEPGITLQADVPTANLIALIEAARRPSC
jgi:uroporphyrinogen decarboxylase